MSRFLPELVVLVIIAAWALLGWRLDRDREDDLL